MHLFLFIILFPFLLFSQKDYTRNSHVIIETKIGASDYTINYSFKDHFDELNTLNLSFNKNKIDKAISKFGVLYSVLDEFHNELNSPELLEFSYRTEKEKREKLKKIKDKEKKILDDRDMVLSNGFLYEFNNTIQLDYNAIVSFYRPYFQTIAKELINLLKKKGKDSKKNRIEIAMKFIQDIPYAIPNKSLQKEKNGCLAPLEVLIKGYGDCDSKSLLFVCILSYMIDPDDIMFVIEPNHVFTAVHYNKFVFEGAKYYASGSKQFYLCETVGPGRFNFGEQTKTKSRRKLTPLRIK